MPSFLLRLCLFCLLTFPLTAQTTWPVAAPSDERNNLYAFTNATIYTNYQTRLENATLLVRNGKVEAVGQKIVIPSGAILVNCTGQTIYPAFIDAYAANFGQPAAENTGSGQGWRGRPQPLSNKRGPYAWNEALKPEVSAALTYKYDPKAAEEWLKLGFATLSTHQADGISRGTAAVVNLSDEREHEAIVLPQSAHHLSFRKGRSAQSYPASLMGCIALLRQTYLDGRWYSAEGKKSGEYNESLEAWNRAQALPQVFEATDKLDVLRIARLGQEFGVNFVVKTAGDEYQRLTEIKATNQALIVPLNFPSGYDVSDPYAAEQVSIRDLKHWELAPANLARLEAAGIPFAITTDGLKDKSQFWANLRKAIEHGLSETAALKALTEQPAQMLRCSAQAGSLEQGKFANFILTTGNIFSADTKILQTWVKGKSNVFRPNDEVFPPALFGVYNLTFTGEKPLEWIVEAKKGQPNVYILRSDSTKTKVNFTLKNSQINWSYATDTITKKSVIGTGSLLPATGDGKATAMARANGRAQRPDGAWTDWRLEQVSVFPLPTPTKQAPVKSPETGAMMYPFVAFGGQELPKAGVWLIRGATVWTNEREGIMPEADVLIQNGKIAKVGKNLPVQDNAIVIEAQGMHLTAGIIDEHSHIAASRSINEGTQESSAEVRIGDVIDSEDIDIYRQLAGGVTSSHILHGSANPIGGQTQLIKLRWGRAPEEMKFGNWPGQIKFALGENVKQSNWGDNFTSRYPQTRMGVEQTFVDYFTRAREYDQAKKTGKPVRTDLELEALAEILNQKRFITCHSYVQSEILMLMRVAERFGFRVNTFTHILEGYKVADIMAKHGVGGSTFSDWWAYKMEVYDAIPYNAAIMHKQGVIVAINSDDAEMARRLNQEAAKAVEYGGMSEEDAWKTVTLNPAKLLRVDDRVGSIRVGKEADLVLWNAHPLSVYATAQTTWVDGIPYYDRKRDEQQRTELRTERARLIQKMLSSGKGGPGGEKPTGTKHHYHCDSEEDEG
jgi:imidazolonepropionase-like amidohydrolase